jgi:hypothetical protein
MINKFITYGSYGIYLAIIFLIFGILQTAVRNLRIKSSDNNLPLLSTLPI